MGRFTTIGSAIFLSIGGLLFGYDSGIISSTIAQPHFVEYMGTPSAAERGGIVSSFTGGAIIGAASASFIADPLGRKRGAMIGAVIAVIGAALQGGAVNIGMMIAGRLLGGVAIGQLSTLVPMYCGEIAPAAHRGKLSGTLQVMLSWGFFLAQWIGFGCFKVDSAFQWRFPLLLQIAPPLIMVAGSPWLPESPRWLVERGRHEEARAVLQRLRSGNTDENLISLEFNEIRDTIAAEKQVSVKSWKEMVSRPSWRKRVILAMGLQAFSQLSGVNVINYYGPQIYKLLGIDTGDALKIIGIGGSLSILWTTLGLLSLDRVGRIKPLVVSAAGMAAVLLVNSVMAKFFVVAENPSPNNNALRAMVAMNFAFSLFFTYVGIISWVYPAEIFPAEIRARGTSVSTFTNWSLNLVFAQCAPIGLQNIGFSFFYFFFAFNFVAAICYALFYPETKGKSLEQMDEVFGDHDVVEVLQHSGGVDKAEDVAHVMHVTENKQTV